MKVFDTLDLRDPAVVVGQHAVWLPAQHLKVPFQWGGRIQKYRHPEEAASSLGLLGEEYALLQYLAERRAAPPVGDWAYFQTVISEHPGAAWADPCGAYGYEMADAAARPPGVLTPGDVPAQIQALTGSLLSGSAGAWNDLNKPGNVINGYLVDVRRSAWDRLQWHGPLAQVPVYREDSRSLLAALHRDGQFPFQAREVVYQEVCLHGGGWIGGERSVRQRAAQLTYHPWFGETVLDIGTQVGGFLHWAVDRLEAPTTATYMGLDTQPEYVDLARRVARHNGWNLCFWERDLFAESHSLLDFLDYLGKLWPQGVDHCLMLSMLKHLPHGEADIWRVYDLLQPKALYLESNAVKDEGTTFPLRPLVEAHGGRYLGDSLDRNRRRLYVVPARA